VDVHVGAWLAMEEAGVRPSHVFGCSAGAVVSAMQATGMTAREAYDVVNDLPTEAVVRKRFAWKVRLLLGWKLHAKELTHFLDPAPVEALLAEYLPEDFDDLAIPLTVSATNMGFSRERDEYPNYFFRGPRLREAVQASLSIPGVWPYVEIDGVPHSDGGTTDAVIVPSDLETYDEFWVVDVVRKRPFRDRDRNMVSRLLWAVEKLTEFDAAETARRLQDARNVRWLDLDIGDVSCLEFDHRLIWETYLRVRRELSVEPGHGGTVNA